MYSGEYLARSGSPLVMKLDLSLESLISTVRKYRYSQRGLPHVEPSPYRPKGKESFLLVIDQGDFIFDTIQFQLQPDPPLAGLSLQGISTICCPHIGDQLARDLLISQTDYQIGRPINSGVEDN